MNPTLRRSIAAAAVLLPVLSGCGFDRPTDRVYNPGVGVNERSGSVDVLGALIVAKSDGSGTVVAGLSNNDTRKGDALTGISGAGKDSGVKVTLDGPVDIKPGALVQLVDETVATAKGAHVKRGWFVRLTFSFENSQDVTVAVPVVAKTDEFADVPVS